MLTASISSMDRMVQELNVGIIRLIKVWGKPLLLVVTECFQTVLHTHVDSQCFLFIMVIINLISDQFHFASSDGAIPTQDPDILSNYSLNYRFNRLANYARTQWTDVRDHVFMNWFTVGMTSTKYVLLLKVNNLTAGDYRLIVKNNYPTNGQFTKKAFYT
jgi:hypothetical protein